jgi:hypothetical protein
MTRRIGMVASLLALGFLALALATCVSWPTPPEPVTRGPGVGLLDATAIPEGIYAIDYLETSGANCTEWIANATGFLPLSGGAVTSNWAGPQYPQTGIFVCNMCASGLLIPFTFRGHAEKINAEVMGEIRGESASETFTDLGLCEGYPISRSVMSDTISLAFTSVDNSALLTIGSMSIGVANECVQTSDSWHTYAIGIGADPTAQPTAGYGACNLGSTLTPTLTPTPYPTYTPGPTSTPTPTATATTIPATATAAAAQTATAVALTATSAALTATPTATGTATPTLTPWPTLTPRFTRTPTPTPTRTPNWPLQNCPQLAVTVDGSLTEWAAVTPVALNVGAAAEVLIAPSLRATWTPVPTATPKTGAGTATVTPRPTATTRPTSTPAPAVADFAGLLYCAHDGAGTLYLAGTLTDSQIVNPVGLLTNGDAAEISLDMYADNFRQPGRDDHVITIAPNGRTADFAIYPLAATAATGAAAGLWRFELALPATTHGRAGLDTGDVIGGTWGYYDNRGGTTWAYRLTATKRRMVLQ